MVWPAIAGFALSAAGSYAQKKASDKREDADKEHLERIRKAHKKFAAKNKELSSEAIDGLLKSAGAMRARMLLFLTERTESEREAVAQQAESDAIRGAAAAGDEFAQQLTADAFNFGEGNQTVTGFGDRMAAREGELTEAEQELRGQAAASRARSAMDLEQAQSLQLDRAPIQQDAAVEAALVGAERAGLRSQYQQRLAELDAQAPTGVGDNLGLAGALANIAGQATLSASAYRDK